MQFKAGESVASLGLTGGERFTIAGLGEDLAAGATVQVSATADNGDAVTFDATVRLDTAVDVDYYRNGGILQTVIRGMLD